MLLYHVHLEVPDVPSAEQRFLDRGFRLIARFGYLGRTHQRFEPEVPWEELREQDVRLRLVELERGAVNVVLMRSRFPEERIGQVGFSMSSVEREEAIARARRMGLMVRGNDVRTFISTGGHFDLEFTDADRYQYDRHTVAAFRLGSLEVACPNPERVARLVRELGGNEMAGRVRLLPSPQPWAELRDWDVGGSASPLGHRAHDQEAFSGTERIRRV